MATVSIWGRRAAATTAATLMGLTGSTGAAEEQPDAAPTASSVQVDYGCYVEFPGGSAIMPYSLTFATEAPATAVPKQRFKVKLDPPVITPNPSINSAVRNVRVKYRLPDNATLVRYKLSGGSGLDGTHSVVAVDADAHTLALTQVGTLPAGEPFDLPTVTLTLWSWRTGVVETGTAGETIQDPTFTWERIDLEGNQTPFKCVATPHVVFTSTAIDPV